MSQMTLEELIDITRAQAGEAEQGMLDGDVIDVLFEYLGYDSVALLEVVSEIKHRFGVDLSDEAVGSARTPRKLLALINQAIDGDVKRRSA